MNNAELKSQDEEVDDTPDLQANTGELYEETLDETSSEPQIFTITNQDIEILEGPEMEEHFIIENTNENGEMTINQILRIIK